MNSSDETGLQVAADFVEAHLREPLLHGSDEHREWLKQELRKWIPEIACLLQKEKE